MNEDAEEKDNTGPRPVPPAAPAAALLLLPPPAAAEGTPAEVVPVVPDDVPPASKKLENGLCRSEDDVVPVPAPVAPPTAVDDRAVFMSGPEGSSGCGT